MAKLNKRKFNGGILEFSASVRRAENQAQKCTGAKICPKGWESETTGIMCGQNTATK